MQTIVLVVRGTLSSKDLLTDALVAESALPSVNGASLTTPIFVHTGFLRVRDRGGDGFQNSSLIFLFYFFSERLVHQE